MTHYSRITSISAFTIFPKNQGKKILVTQLMNLDNDSVLFMNVNDRTDNAHADHFFVVDHDGQTNWVTYPDKFGKGLQRAIHLGKFHYDYDSKKHSVVFEFQQAFLDKHPNLKLDSPMVLLGVDDFIKSEAFLVNFLLVNHPEVFNNDYMNELVASPWFSEN